MGGSDYDTLLAVYTGTAVNALTGIVANDDHAPIGLDSLVTFNAVAGTTYRIAVDGYQGAVGNYVLTLYRVTNTAPTDISLSASSVNENAAANTVVGTLSTTDANAGNTFIYSLVSGTGDTNNASFNLSGTSLRTSAVFNFEAVSSYSVRIRTMDQTGLFFDKAFTITITNLPETPIELWRQANFGGVFTNTGNGANTANPDGDGNSNLLEFAFGINPNASSSSELVYTGTLAGSGVITATGLPAIKFEPSGNGVDFRALFVRRKDYVLAGLTYTPQFSANLSTWQNSAAVPAVLADDGTHQIVSVPYPSFIAGRKARFFQISVSIAP